MTAALISAAPAVSQPAPPPPNNYGAAPSQTTPADQSDRLRQTLRLRPDQEGALQAFVAAMRPRPDQTQQFRDEAMRDAALPTPQRLDAMVARTDEMRAVMMAKVRATKTFYGQLTQDQQRIFDRLPPPSR